MLQGVSVNYLVYFRFKVYTYWWHKNAADLVIWQEIKLCLLFFFSDNVSIVNRFILKHYIKHKSATEVPVEPRGRLRAVMAMFAHPHSLEYLLAGSVTTSFVHTLAVLAPGTATCVFA